MFVEAWIHKESVMHNLQWLLVIPVVFLLQALFWLRGKWHHDFWCPFFSAICVLEVSMHCLGGDTVFAFVSGVIVFCFTLSLRDEFLLDAEDHGWKSVLANLAVLAISFGYVFFYTLYSWKYWGLNFLAHCMLLMFVVAMYGLVQFAVQYIQYVRRTG